MTEQGLCVQENACMVDVLMEERKDVLVGYKGKRKKMGRRRESEEWRQKGWLSLSCVFLCLCVREAEKGESWKKCVREASKACRHHSWGVPHKSSKKWLYGAKNGRLGHHLKAGLRNASFTQVPIWRPQTISIIQQPRHTTHSPRLKIHYVFSDSTDIFHHSTATTHLLPSKNQDTVFFVKKNR